MSFLYHFRVLERGAATVRVRVWITSPDVLAWGAKAVPKNVKNIQNTRHFAMLLLREQCAEGDAQRVGAARAVEKAQRQRDAALAAGKPVPSDDGGAAAERAYLNATGLQAIRALAVDGIANFPAPKAAWDPKTPAAREQHEAYWRGVSERDPAADPPEHLARFDLTIELADPSWMPSAWPDGVKGTTAYAMS